MTESTRTQRVKQIITQLGIATPYVPVALSAIATYHTTGPPRKSWSLQFYVVWRIIRYLLYRHNTFDKLDDVQTMTKSPNPNTSAKAIVSFEDIPRNKEAIDFMVDNSPHLPADARDSDDLISGEWVSASHQTVDNAHQKVVYMLHGGAYIAGSPQIERRLAYHIARSSRCRTFGIST